MQHNTVHRTRPHARATVWAVSLAAAGAVALSGCGRATQTVHSSPPHRTGDAFTQRAAQIVQDWPKVSPVAGRHEALLPLAGADRPASKDVRELTVTVGHSACDAGYGARVMESKELVVVSGWGKRKNPKGVCTEQLATHRTKVRLSSPLAGREVVDAATGKRLLKG
ncbi:hypothetical protein ACH4VR_18180 [Streptomyces sp. NPDC020883]|uniref:hypothetical protein n=1 Tax=Streptomyces sp. NPDC020883 TaxID=3365099 RepID=UPI00379C1526